MTSEVENVGQKHTFTHNLRDHNFQLSSLFYSSTVTCSDSYTVVTNTSTLPSKIDQMRVFQKTGSEALDSDMPWCLPTLECILWGEHF